MREACNVYFIITALARPPPSTPFRDMRALAPVARPRTLHARSHRRRARAVAPRALADVDVGAILSNPSTGAAYELVEKLGAGSTAETFRALDANGNEVAVKTLTLRSRRGGPNGGFKAVELFERESQVLRALRHPGVPAYVDHFAIDTEDDRRYVLVQRLARGRSLQRRVDEGWRPTEGEVISVLRALLTIAEYCSSLRPPVIHRDVKPANVVMDDDGEVSLVDFGSAAAAAIDSVDGGGFGSTIVGTFGYMAPEVMMRSTSPRCDQYGIGATALFLLSGRPPSGFKMERLKVNFDEVYIEDRRLRRVIERLLEPSPEDRYRDPREALDALDATTPMVSGRNFRSRPAETSAQIENPSIVYGQPMMVQYGGEQPMAPSYKPRGAPKPKTMTTQVTRIPGNSVSIDIPPSGANGAVLYKAFFGVTWTGITALWTIGVLSAGAWFMALFSIPFWKVGADLSGDVLRSFLARGDVFIDRQNFRVVSEGGGMKFMEKVGDTSDIEGAFVRGDGMVYLKLEDDSVVPILASLSRKEAEYVASEINALLEEKN